MHTAQSRADACKTCMYAQRHSRVMKRRQQHRFLFSMRRAGVNSVGIQPFLGLVCPTRAEAIVSKGDLFGSIKLRLQDRLANRVNCAPLQSPPDPRDCETARLSDASPPPHHPPGLCFREREVLVRQSVGCCWYSSRYTTAVPLLCKPRPSRDLTTGGSSGGCLTVVSIQTTEVDGCKGSHSKGAHLQTSLQAR